MLSSVLAVALGLGTAQAVEDPLRFEKVQRRGKVALIMGAAGPPVFIVGLGAMGAGGALGSGGLALGGFTVAGVGAGSTIVGAPLLAASSVRGATLSGTDRTLGYTAWGLWGASLLTGSASEVYPEYASAASAVGLGCYVGSLVAGGLQLRQNRATAEGVASWQLAPTPEGVVLAGRF